VSGPRWPSWSRRRAAVRTSPARKLLKSITATMPATASKDGIMTPSVTPYSRHPQGGPWPTFIRHQVTDAAGKVAIGVEGRARLSR
jgi:hypothetical protein